MNIERIRFGTSSIYRPSAISKLVREDKQVLTDQAVTLEGEKRQAKDQEQHSDREQDAQKNSDAGLPSAALAEKPAESFPLDIVA